MDFRVKKLILEEGMKNIAETEGVGLEMDFNDYHKIIKVDFKYNIPGTYRIGNVHKECSYDSLDRRCSDVFYTIEELRREVKNMKSSGSNHIYEVKCDWKTFESIRRDYADLMGTRSSKIPKIKNVIFNYPATIVFWEDGDKTVVKCQNDDIYDAEKGLAMAIIKKMNGGKGNYCEIFKPWIEKYEKERMEAFFKEQDELMKRGAQKFVIESLKEDDVIAEATVDIQDILEGRVDPLMIKVDEEVEKPVEKSCNTCDHKHKKVYESPCKRCLEDTNAVLYKWEPRKKETKAPDVVKKTCWNCANHSFEKDKEPCCSCTTRRRNGTIHRNWEPKE